MAKKKNAHGGAREGAGRPPANGEGKTKVVAASVPESLADDLDGFAAEKGWNRSQAITEAIRTLLKRK
ncbi:MAG: ribbon-helix-helix domain-containing protein [Planctomycetota bacterium]